MPYTPSGGYYERKPRSPRLKDMKYLSEAYVRSEHTGVLNAPKSFTPAQKLKVQGFNRSQASRLAGRLGPQPKTGKYAVLICFDSKFDAQDVHREIVALAKTRGRGVDLNAFLSHLQNACSVALHDCQKHPLNVKY